MAKTVKATLTDNHEEESIALLIVTFGTNGAGGLTETESELGRVSGLVSNPNASEQSHASSIGVEEAVIITVPTQTAITHAQRLRRANGETYEVVEVPPEDSWSTGIRVLCKRRED